MNYNSYTNSQAFIMEDASYSPNSKWKHSEDHYQERSLAVKLAKKACYDKDTRFMDKDKNIPTKVTSKAKNIFRHVQEMDPIINVSSQQVILKNWTIESQKYIQYSSGTQNSSDNQLQIEYPQYDQMMNVISKDKQQGKYYLIVKVKSNRDKKIQIQWKRLKGVGSDVPIITLSERRQNYYLYKVTLINQYKLLFNFNLKIDDKIVAATKNYNFKLEVIQYDSGISYDCIQEQSIQMTQLEGILASVTFNNVDNIDFFQRATLMLNSQRSLFSRGDYIFEQTFLDSLKNAKYIDKILIIVQKLIRQPQDKSNINRHYENKTIQQLCQFFMSSVINYQIKVNETKKMNQLALEKIINTFIKLRSLQKINNKNWNILQKQNQQDLNKKLCEIIIYFIQNRKFKSFQTYLSLQIKHSLSYLQNMMGLDTLVTKVNQSTLIYDNDYVNVIMKIIYYFISSQKNQKTKTTLSVIKILLKCFKSTPIEWNQEQKRSDEIKSYQQFIVNSLEFSESFQNIQLYYQFIKFCKSTKDINLQNLLKSQSLKKKITDFMNKLQRQLNSCKQGKQLETLLQILVNYNLQNLKSQQLLTSLKRIQNKVFARSNSSKTKCITIHIFVLNEFMKKHQQIEYIKSFLVDLKKQFIKLSYQEMMHALNFSFQIDIFPSIQVQQVYTKDFVKQCIKQKVNKDTIKQIDNNEKQFIQWHNYFGYKSFINQVLLEIVSRQISSFHRDSRDRVKSLDRLIQIVNKSKCPQQEKQNLCYIIQSDSFNIEQQNILKVFRSQRRKLVILNKLIEENNKKIQLRNILQNIKRKLLSQTYSFNIIEQIASATQYQQNMINSIFGCEKDIFQTIKKMFIQGNQFVYTIQRYRIFIGCVNQKYHIIDYHKVIECLSNIQVNFKQSGYQFKQKLTSDGYFKHFDDQILKCYNFKCFFKGEKQQNIPFTSVVQNCKTLLDRIIINRDVVIKQYQNRSLTYESLDFFKQQLSNIKQLSDLFLIGKDNQQTIQNKQMIRELLQIFELLKKIQKLQKPLNAIINLIKSDQSIKYKQLGQKIINFSQYIHQISQKNPHCNISKLFEQFEMANQVISKINISKTQKLNLNNQRTLNLLTFLYYILENQQINMPKLIGIKSQLQNLKENCDELDNDFLVTYQQLEKAETIINYFQKVYTVQKANLRNLMIQTLKHFQQYTRLQRSYTIFTKIESFMIQYENLKTPNKKLIDKVRTILNRCRISLKFDNNSKISIQIIQNQSIINQNQIKTIKNQVILWLQQSNNKDNQEEKLKIKDYQCFLDILKKVDSILQIWEKLRRQGYIIFLQTKEVQKNSIDQQKLSQKQSNSKSQQDISIQVKQGNTQILTNYVKELKEKCQLWNQKTAQLHDISSKATQLQGISIRNFFEVITNKSPNKIINFLTICKKSLIQQFQKLNKIYKQESIYAIGIIKQFFQFYLTKTEREILNLKDYSQSYIKTILLNQSTKDFIYGLIQIDSNRIRNLDLTKLLICKNDTTFIDIKSFIETALHDQKNEYIIIRPEKLSNRNQQFIINQIKSYQADKKKKITLKLCLITNTQLENLYQYMVSNFSNGKNQATQQARRIAYKQMIVQKTQNFKIVRSKQPGFGKTRYILDECKANKNRKCIFFPITGCPKSKQIYEQFSSICTQIFIVKQKQKQDCALVIQIHNIDPQYYQIVNTSLQQILLCRGIRYDGHFPNLLEDTTIYVQLENIQKVNDFDPLVKLTFLKQLINQQGRYILKDINIRKKVDFSLFDQKQLSYVILHLSAFDDKILDSIKIDRFDQFEPKQQDQQLATRLIDKYFYSKMQTQNPTFYQLQYFFRLLFQGCRAFSNSYYLTIQNFQQNFRKNEIQLYQLYQIRQEFFKVILDNCRQFIQRDVDYNEFTHQNQNTQKKLKNIPFLIIANKDGQSFSFIYRESKNVPKSIRNFYISQDPIMMKQIDRMITRQNLSPKVQQNIKNQQSESQSSQDDPIQTQREKHLSDVFQKHSITKLQKLNPKQFNEKVKQILLNISGNDQYKGANNSSYVVNIDNFFKMCLITLRQRQNIPIVIMGQAGIGKTALIQYITKNVYNHQFYPININAGTTKQKLRQYLGIIKQKAERIQEDKNTKKKLWVFFDQFNTLKEVGYIKEIVIDKRFQGKALDFLQNVVILAACNPFRRVRRQQGMRRQIDQDNNQQQNLAFHVLPPPHSMIESMWNYGQLKKYQYEKYIERMISNVQYHPTKTTQLLLSIHSDLAKKFDSSFVSLRDIERFRKIYDFFDKKLPRQPHKNTKVTHRYKQFDERAIVMSFVLCYVIRIDDNQTRTHICQLIQQKFQLAKGRVLQIKQTEETDFYNRLSISSLPDKSIAANKAIKQNIYCVFVAIYNRLSMIIVGPPGCSKSLSIRILSQNMKGKFSQQQYLSRFQSIRALNFQGSQLCRSKQIQQLFQRAQKPSKNSQQSQQNLVVIVFDQIGLADQSKQNPLKVLHPYLQVNKGKQKNYAFVSISNTDLDVSKMSRMFALRRSALTQQELYQTAIGIGNTYQYGRNPKINKMIGNLAKSYFDFIKTWKQLRYKSSLFGLRDFYSLIKCFLNICTSRDISLNDDRQIDQIISLSIYKNFSGNSLSVMLFTQSYYKSIGRKYIANQQKIFDVVENILSCLQKQNLRFPLVIVEDEESLSYLVNLLLNKFGQRHAYFEKSPFPQDVNNSTYVIQTTANISKTLQKGQILLLNNIEATIQTSLYDMLNKFYIQRDDQKYCRISNMDTGFIKKIKVNKQFNCIFFLLESNLQKTEAPFLSRFQKYKFNLTQAQQTSKIDTYIGLIQNFKNKIVQVCKKNQINHYKLNDFFQNCQKETIKTLVLRIINELKTNKIKHQEQPSQQDVSNVLINKVISQMVMNSTQDFNLLYKFVLSKSNQLKNHHETIIETLQKKKQFTLRNATDVILFTTDANFIIDHKKIQANQKIIDLEYMKEQQSFNQNLKQFFNNSKTKFLYIFLADRHSKCIQYLISQIQKVKIQQRISKQIKLDDKHIFLIFVFNRKQLIERKQSEKLVPISFLNQYRQIFYEGIVQDQPNIKYGKQQFFQKVLDLKVVLQHAADCFQFSYKQTNEDNIQKLMKIFKLIYTEITQNKQNIIHQHTQDIISQTIGTNVVLTEQIVLQILRNSNNTKQFKNIKQAISYNLSSKHFMGVVGSFFKYLFENQTFLSYSSINIHEYNKALGMKYDLQTQKFIKVATESPTYKHIVQQIFKKKISHLKSQYIYEKNSRLLPSPEKKLKISLERGRFFHFSKSQIDIFFVKQADSLSQIAFKSITVEDSKRSSKAFEFFKRQLYKKSFFVIQNQNQSKTIQTNLYNKINQDKNVKALYFLQILTEFVENKGINNKFIILYKDVLSVLIDFNNLDIQSTIYVLLGFQQIISILLKLFSVFFENGIMYLPDRNNFTSKIANSEHIKSQYIELFVDNLISKFFKLTFISVNSRLQLKGKLLFDVFTNCMIHIQNLSKIMKNIKIPTILISMKDLTIFLAEFNEQTKYQLLAQYMKEIDEKNIYPKVYNFVQNLLKQSTSAREKQLIGKFQANKIFIEWFKQKKNDKNCFKFFVDKCDTDTLFCHNSIHVFNYLFERNKIDYHNIEGVNDELNNAEKQLSQFAQHSKKKMFKNNLCILMINIFWQKINKTFSHRTHQQILESHKQIFIKYYKKLSANDQRFALLQVFLFAYVKFVLVSYSELILKQKFDAQIGQLLCSDSDLSINSRLFCLKILRKKLIPKQIKQKFILIKRVAWSSKIEHLLKQEQSRSIVVPKDNCSQQMSIILEQIQSSQGSAYQSIEKALQLCQNFQNRYSFINFFMRFYYSLSYNQKAWKSKTIQYFKQKKSLFQQKLGIVQTKLIQKYICNQISQELSLKAVQQVEEQDFIISNIFNLFISSKASISPLHSLFIKDGVICQDLCQLLKDQFILSGPQNPFINIASTVHQLTRNCDIGVYLCSNDCDYIYLHENCGWPKDIYNCPMCGQKIGCEKLGNHKLSRVDQGARRLINKSFLDNSNFYIWNFTSFAQFWEMQRKYIDIQVNRMKCKNSVFTKLKQQTQILTGCNMVITPRLSILSSKLIKFLIHSILYFLLTLKVVKSSQIQLLLGKKTQIEAQKFLYNSLRQMMDDLKISLNIGNKFNGWMFGIQRAFIIKLNNFAQEFKNHQVSQQQSVNKIKEKLNIIIKNNKLHRQYINLYIECVKDIQSGLFTKQLNQVKDLSAKNRFTRDLAQKLLQSQVKAYSDQKKFQFSNLNQSLQGKMQFPLDVLLTQDKLDQQQYVYSRIFKLPDQQIKYNQIITKFQITIRQNYPFLDYILKQESLFIQMKNFTNIILFMNQLKRHVNNQFQRTKSEVSLGKFINELKNQYQHSLNHLLKEPQQMLKSWKEVATFLDVLRNQCTTVGRMGDQYDLDTPIKAFILDQSTKQNPQGLIIASLYHNFAKIHNECLSLLNSRKNLIKSYSSLNLINDLLKLHPQQLKGEQVLTINESEFSEKLQQYSVCSIVYGQNFIYHNFDAYQSYFISKLQGKCQIISILKSFISICYNGQAFSAQSQSSGTLTQVRNIFDQNMSPKSLQYANIYIEDLQPLQPSQFQEQVVFVRGDIEKIMIVLNTLKGSYPQQKPCSQIVNDLQINVKSRQMSNGSLSSIKVCEIVHLYQYLQEKLKPFIMQKLNAKYKKSLPQHIHLNFENFLMSLPTESHQDNVYPTIYQLQSALYKFTARNLQSGIFEGQKQLFLFVISRQDFWPKDYDDMKKGMLICDQTIKSFQVCHTYVLLSMMEKCIKTVQKVSVRKMEQ